MSNVEFDIDNGSAVSFPSRRVFDPPKVSRMVKIVMSTGITKDEQTAYSILLAFGMFCLVAAVFIFLFFGLRVGRGSTHLTEKEMYQKLMDVAAQLQKNQKNK